MLCKCKGGHCFLKVNKNELIALETKTKQTLHFQRCKEINSRSKDAVNTDKIIVQLLGFSIRQRPHQETAKLTDKMSLHFTDNDSAGH